MLWLHVFRIKCSIFSVLAALLCVFPSDHLFRWYCPIMLLMSLSVCCSFFFFLSQHRVFGDLCCLWRQAVARAVRGSTWFCSGSGAGQTRRPLRLRPESRTCSSGADKGLHSLWGRRCCGVGGLLGDEESESGLGGGVGWRTKSKGSYPPGSNTCHQLLPPSCAFIKKPPCAPQGNPHALLKKCEVNTVCLSISLPLPSLFTISFPPLLPLSLFL